MWLFLALLAAVFWGLAYAAAGRLFERGLSPVGFFFCQLVFGIVVVGGFLAASGRVSNLAGDSTSYPPSAPRSSTRASSSWPSATADETAPPADPLQDVG
jgi:hypothetical protein